MENNNLIYHYCSLNTFLTIIDKKTLRLTDVTKSNDYLERIYLLLNSTEIILNVLKKKYPNIASEQVTKDINKHISDYSERSIISHAMCFSKDSDKLSQWRGYADDGRGVSIGFDRAEIQNVLDEKHFGVSDVIYGTDDSKLEYMLQSILREIEQEAMYNSATPVSICDIICKEIVVRLFLEEALLYKNPAFVEENEVRIHTKIPKSEFGLMTYKDISNFIQYAKKEDYPLNIKYDFAAKRNTIYSYFDIEF